MSRHPIPPRGMNIAVFLRLQEQKQPILEAHVESSFQLDNARLNNVLAEIMKAGQEFPLSHYNAGSVYLNKDGLMIMGVLFPDSEKALEKLKTRPIARIVYGKQADEVCLQTLMYEDAVGFTPMPDLLSVLQDYILGEVKTSRRDYAGVRV